MVKFIKDKLRRPYHLLKHTFSAKPTLDFDYDTLPLIDKNVSIDEVLKRFDVPSDTPYDIKEKLEFWRENGYVVLENVLPKHWLDTFWDEVEDTIENHEKHTATGLVYQFNDQKATQLKNIPKELLKGIGARINDYHNTSVGAKRIMTHRHIVTFLKAALSPELTAFQSLVFKYSSQQPTHQDFPWVTSSIPSHLAAAWIPCEDVHEDSGPLFYYPGSHKIPKFNFGRTGILYKDKVSLFSPIQFSEYLDALCKEHGIAKKVLLIKKGDILIWHGGLAHGGSIINNPEMTRKSFVCHYSTVEAQPKHRYEHHKDVSETSYYNGVAIYKDPTNPTGEDVVTGGKDWVE
jgi:ectoine hydroxylase-related dioxygenase (phytanoyl-CoA dioxygenase family)